MDEVEAKKLLICCGFDSFIKASYPVCKVFERNGYLVNYFLLNDGGVVDKKHLAEIGFDHQFESGPLRKILNNQSLSKYQAVMLSLKGPEIYQVMSVLSDVEWPYPCRPVFFGGYCGIVYEKFAIGLLARQPLDVFFVNSKHDYDLFHSMLAEYGICDVSNIKLTGLPLLDLSHNLPFPSENRKIKNLLFAGQPTVPESLTERTCVVHFLIEYCEKYPDRNVYLKPRHRPNQDSVHKTLFHYQRIMESISKKRTLPPNLQLTYESILHLLDRVDFCLTVSSTAAFEAVNKGVNVGFLMDFGVREDYGTTYFASSGCAVNFNSLLADKQIKPNLSWWSDRYLSDGNNSQRLFDAVDAIVNHIQESKELLPFRHNFNKEISSYYEEFRRNDIKISYRSGLRNFFLKVYYFLKVKGFVE